MEQRFIICKLFTLITHRIPYPQTNVPCAPVVAGRDTDERAGGRRFHFFHKTEIFIIARRVKLSSVPFCRQTLSLLGKR